MNFLWEKSEYDAGYQARVGNFTLSVAPTRIKFNKAVRGAKWRAFVSQWDEKSRSSTRYGQDVYNELRDTPHDAMRLAEAVFITRRW